MVLFNRIGQDGLQHFVHDLHLSIFWRVIWSKHPVLDFEFLSNGPNKLKNHSKKSSHSHDFPLLKLFVKFDFPTYDGELNSEKLDNWVNQIEVYCKVQKIIKDTSNIQLVDL
jgi:hypothetical protein